MLYASVRKPLRKMQAELTQSACYHPGTTQARRRVIVGL